VVAQLLEHRRTDQDNVTRRLRRVHREPADAVPLRRGR
jgi:hypothetical protein